MPPTIEKAGDYGWGPGTAQYDTTTTTAEDGATEPMFSLGRVQFSLPTPLHSLACASNILYFLLLGLPPSHPSQQSARPHSPSSPSTTTPSSSSPPQGKSPSIIRIDLSKPTDVENIDLPLPPPTGRKASTTIGSGSLTGGRQDGGGDFSPPTQASNSPSPSTSPIPPLSSSQPPPSSSTGAATAAARGSKLYKMHVDPTGRHVIVSTTLGDNFYLFAPTTTPNSNSQTPPQRKIRTLTKSRGLVISSVGWNPNSTATYTATSGAAAAVAAAALGSGSGGNQQQQQPVLNASTGPIMLGTTSGQIFETCLLDPEAYSTSSLSSSSSSPFPELPFSFPNLSNLPRPGGGNMGGNSGNNSSAPSDRYHRPLYHIPPGPDRSPIVGLRWDVWGGPAGSGGAVRKGCVIVTTRNNRMMQFVGMVVGGRGVGFGGGVGSGEGKGGGDMGGEEGYAWEGFFEKYGEGLGPKTLELPGEVNRSSLYFHYPIRQGPRGEPILAAPNHVAWLTGHGIYHGSLTFTSSTPVPGDGLIESGQLLPYPISAPTSPRPLRMSTNRRGGDGPGGMESRTPVGMALTEFHFVLVYETGETKVMSRLDNKVVWEEELELRPGEIPLGISSDPVRKLYWIYTEQSIFELIVKDEDRNVWKVYLNKQDWDTALRFAKNPRQRDLVLTAQGDAYYSSAKYIPAAQSYAQSSKSFEQVVLRFVDKDERDALRYYLIARLERLKRTDLTQRMMLATWLVEIYLAKINQLEDMEASEGATEEAENFKAERMMIEEDMKQFLETYKDNLDTRTTFDLIASHGRSEMMLHYAGVVGDHERIMSHWILEEEWGKALETLSRQDSLDIYYRYAAPLIRSSPKKTVDALMRQPDLDVLRLLPALVRPGLTSSHESSTYEHILRYLQYVVLQLHNTSPAVHNALVTLFATSPSSDESPLIRFLAASADDPETGKPYYDLDYALRICKANKRIQSCVEIYSKMGLWECSVDLALETGDVELAMMNADKASGEGLGDEGLRKRLWLKLAKYVVETKKDIKTAMKFLETTDVLKIEDILPFFPDFVVIDEFKEDICKALEGYAGRIDHLKDDMNEATRSAEAIKDDIADLRTRFVVLDEAERCASCKKGLLTRQFYVFPCQHAFHADCLISEVTQHLSPRILRRIIDLQNRITLESNPKSASMARMAKPSSTLPPFPTNASALNNMLIAGSVTGLDQLRKLIVPDALVGVITGDIIGARRREGAGEKSGLIEDRGGLSTANKAVVEKLRSELDDLLASSCVYCDLAVASLDRPFVAEGEPEM